MAPVFSRPFKWDASTFLVASFASVCLISLFAKRPQIAKRLQSSSTRQNGLRAAYRGMVVHSIALGKLEVIEDALLAVDSAGRVESLKDLSKLSNEDKNEALTKVNDVLVNLGNRFIIPGFVDAHAHAPQYAYVGTGMDLPLLQWLETYTFPAEASFTDTSFAKDCYQKAVRRHLGLGTTTCSWFATIHLEATKVLVDVLREHGMRGHVGKVSMDRNSPENYIEDTEQGLRDSEAVIGYIKQTGPGSEGRDRLTASLIPRFVPTCTSTMMHGLGQLSAKYCLPVHSHLSESKAEIDWVAQLHPDCDSYTDVYAKHGLLHERSYMAHCCHCTQGEVDLLQARKAGVVHCPSSNFMLKSGVLDVRNMLNHGVKVGLGTDIAGGYSNSMLDSIRQAIIASHTLSFQRDETYQALTYAEMFHLATVGGAEVLGLSDKIGNFTAGKHMDALIVNPSTADSPFDTMGKESARDIFEKFLFLGDDRNIEQVFIEGECVMARSQDRLPVWKAVSEKRK